MLESSSESQDGRKHVGLGKGRDWIDVYEESHRHGWGLYLRQDLAQYDHLGALDEELESVFVFDASIATRYR